MELNLVYLASSVSVTDCVTDSNGVQLCVCVCVWCVCVCVVCVVCCVCVVRVCVRVCVWGGWKWGSG